MTKYGFEAIEVDVKRILNRLTNQLWKLIPMRENHENWENQIDTVLVELVGLNKILYNNEKFLILLSKLEGLKDAEVEFKTYRKTVFETMSLLGELQNERS